MSFSWSAAGTIILLENVRFHPEEEGAGVVDGKKVLPATRHETLFCRLSPASLSI